MKRTLWCALLGLMLALRIHAADEPFSKALTPGDFSAAGLSKLTPDELARLDALVRDFGSGAIAAARREMEAQQEKAAKAEAKAEAEAKAAQAAAEAAAKAEAAARVAQAQAEETAKAAKAREVAEKQHGPSLLERAKVLLKPGTKIEYTTLQSRLTRDFSGWQKHTVFTLENGQSWRVTSVESYYGPVIPKPAVKIVPGALGSFWLEIEGVDPRPRVELLDK